MTPALVVVTGPDGCGKDTCARMFRDELARRGVPHWLTQEPWTSPAGMRIREALRDGDDTSRDHREMALLFALDRLCHLRAMDDMPPGVAVTTRYRESSIVYQGALLELSGDPNGTRWVTQINSIFRAADLTVVIDVPADEAMRRMASSGRVMDSYERQGELQRAVVDRYASLESLMPGDRVVHVDGLGSESVVFRRVLAAIDAALGDSVRGGRR